MMGVQTHDRPRRWPWSLAVSVTVAALYAASVCGQPPNVHYFHHSNMPPGMVGQQQLLRGPTMAGYFQPVELVVPEGVRISLLMDGVFAEPRPAPVVVGMQIGFVYQLKISNIPFREGEEIYPTLELVNRLNPPPGAKLRFPVPVYFTREEIDMALNGQFVTRVIYMEDTDKALPERQAPGSQRFLDVGPTEDPLHVADRLGRPMVILRMGSRLPENPGQPGVAFGAGSPLEIYPEEALAAAAQSPSRSQITNAIERHGEDVRRWKDESRPPAQPRPAAPPRVNGTPRTEAPIQEAPSTSPF